MKLTFAIYKRFDPWTHVGQWNLIPVVQFLIFGTVSFLSQIHLKDCSKQLLSGEYLKRKDILINSAKSKNLQVGKTQENIRIFCNKEVIEVVSNFIYLGAMINRSGKVDSEITNRISKVNTVYYQICNSIIEIKNWVMTQKSYTCWSPCISLSFFMKPRAGFWLKTAGSQQLRWGLWED